MSSAPPPDYYALFGVPSDSSFARIREAYLIRSRVLHPDRFDAQTEAAEWKQANAMLAALNEAYAILKDPDRRHRYDADLKANSRKPEKETTPRPDPTPRHRDEVRSFGLSSTSIPIQVCWGVGLTSLVIALLLGVIHLSNQPRKSELASIQSQPPLPSHSPSPSEQSTPSLVVPPARPQPSALAAKFPSLAHIIDGDGPSIDEIKQEEMLKSLDHNPHDVLNDGLADPQSRMTAAAKILQKQSEEFKADKERAWIDREGKPSTDPLYYPKKIPFVGWILAARENMDAANAEARIKGSNGSAQDYYEAARYLQRKADEQDWNAIERFGNNVLCSGSFAVELLATGGMIAGVFILRTRKRALGKGP